VLVLGRDFAYLNLLIRIQNCRDYIEEALQVEVIRRLAAQRFTAQMIDDTELLGRSVRVNHAWGLLWEYSQRRVDMCFLGFFVYF